MRRLWIHTAILLVAAGLFLYQINVQSVWFDEGWSAHAAAQPGLWQALNADTTNPPLYYGLVYLSGSWTGHSAFGLRWLSFAFGVLSVALTMRLASAVGPWAAMSAGLLATFSAPLAWASQEMRMYTLLAVLVAIIVLAWERLRTQPRSWQAWSLLLLAELAVLYTHNTGPVIVLWLNSISLLHWFFNRRPPMLRWLAGQALVGLLWLPYFLARFLALTEANSALVRRPALSLDIWAALWLSPWEAVTNAPLGLLLLTLGAGFPLLLSLRYPRGRWLLLHPLLIIAGLLVALAILGTPLHGRYLVMVLPPLLAAAGVGLAAVPRPLAGLMMVYFVGLFTVGYSWARSPAYTHDNARGMVRHYAETLTDADTVLAWSYADRYELAYYWDRLHVAAQRITLPEGASLEQVAPLLPTSGDVSLNVWYTQRADYRGMMNCLLAHGTPQPPARHEVNGMATLTYTAPALSLPETQPATGNFTVGEIIETGVLPRTFHAAQPVCLPVSLQLGRPTPAELKAAIVVTNSQEIEIATTSSVFATPNGRTSTDNTLGERLTAYPVVRLPVGTPPGRYQVALRVFDDANLSGYDVLQDGTPTGKNLYLGVWDVQPGATWPSDADELTLTEVTATPPDVNNGDKLTFRLAWDGAENSDTLPNATLQAADNTWTVTVPANISAFDNRVVEYRQVQIPTDAPSGQAMLTLPEQGALSTVNVTNIPAVYTPPTDANPVSEADFPSIGSITHYQLSGSPGEGYTVRLTWQVADTPQIDRDYTVFVQFLNRQGDLIGQSDAQPAGGSRPTTGWRANEYITDTHTIPLPQQVPPGEITLIAGLYDATGRVPLAGGQDFAVLDDAIILEDTH